jgi:hypothetical protein
VWVLLKAYAVHSRSSPQQKKVSQRRTARRTTIRPPDSPSETAYARRGVADGCSRQLDRTTLPPRPAFASRSFTGFPRRRFSTLLVGLVQPSSSRRAAATPGPAVLPCAPRTKRCGESTDRRPPLVRRASSPSAVSSMPGKRVHPLSLYGCSSARASATTLRAQLVVHEELGQRAAPPQIGPAFRSAPTQRLWSRPRSSALAEPRMRVAVVTAEVDDGARRVRALDRF